MNWLLSQSLLVDPFCWLLFRRRQPPEIDILDNDCDAMRRRSLSGQLTFEVEMGIRPVISSQVEVWMVGVGFPTMVCCSFLMGQFLFEQTAQRKTRKKIRHDFYVRCLYSYCRRMLCFLFTCFLRRKLKNRQWWNKPSIVGESGMICESHSRLYKLIHILLLKCIYFYAIYINFQMRYSSWELTYPLRIFDSMIFRTSRWVPCDGIPMRTGPDMLVKWSVETQTRGKCNTT